ncbi:MAG TPA: hypothetical protein VKV39_00395 [Candidatus Sulfotelmatobacter sp.]|nr:hypothetical protein [Candidatus Sulfotelmatobacter sp.]
MTKHTLLALLLSASAIFCVGQEADKVHAPKLKAQTSGTTQLLIAVSPVNSRVVWASGTGGTYVVTTDGGEHWKAGVVPGAENDEFRDVQGVSDKIAYLMSIGNNTTDFKVYKTVDGGAHWTIEFTNQVANAFYDCFAFWTPTRGIMHSDSMNGVFLDERTTNGKTWQSIGSNLPPALPGEASFAASGTCIAAQGKRNAWAVTGGATIARVLATRDGGNTWNAYDTPLVSNPSAGAVSVAFRNAWDGMVAGGDLASNTAADAATSHDGGRTWKLTKKPPVQGAIFCLAYASGRYHDDDDQGEEDHGRTVVVTAETEPNYSSGSAAWTPDEGETWYALPKVSGYWGVAFADPHAGWFVGNNGQILKISF